MLTGEFEREAEQNASGNDKTANDPPELPVADTVHAGHSGSLIPTETEPMLSIAQFTEKFLEQNLSEYTCTLLCYKGAKINGGRGMLCSVFRQKRFALHVHVFDEHVHLWSGVTDLHSFLGREGGVRS